MRRQEAYPEIKTGRGIPGLPRIAVLVGALAVAALALFMLPALLGFGGGGKSSPSPSAGAARPSASVGPTVRPQPTPLVYVIKQGDNLLKVSKKFNVTLEDLLAANKDNDHGPEQDRHRRPDHHPDAATRVRWGVAGSGGVGLGVALGSASGSRASRFGGGARAPDAWAPG